MNYELGNFIVNIFTALGTCGAVIVALWLAMPKKEKAEGYFEFQGLRPNLLPGSSPNYNTLKLEIRNKGKCDIEINNKKNANIKLKDGEELLYLDEDKMLFVPKSETRVFELLTSNIDIKNLQEIYENDNSIILIYTVNGTEIKLKKFPNKDPLGIGKKKKIAVGK